MGKSFPAKLLLLIYSFFPMQVEIKSRTIADGQQPQITVDQKGIVRIVYGQGDQVFCSTSFDEGLLFSKPVLVARIPGMHLGMSRGPQLATSINYSVITAIDKAGDIHWFKLGLNTNKWENMGTLNDKRGSAPEGLMSIAADKNDNFYAVWLDIRTGGNNQIYFSSLRNKASVWSKNNMVYQSPDGHVCECCKPNIAINGSAVALMFRNWLNGSRDLYMVKSTNSGKSFSGAEKLGLDTWKLNGCPMDGGGLTIGTANTIKTTWQRKGMIYYAEPGKPEIFISDGRISSISGTGVNAILSFQQADTLKILNLKNKSVTVAGTGSFIKSALTADDKIFCVWEQDAQIKFRKM